MSIPIPQRIRSPVPPFAATVPMKEQPPSRLLSLGSMCLAAVMLLPLEWWIPGALAWIASVAFLLRDPDPSVKRRLGVLLGCLALLAAAPIHTDTATPHFVILALCFLAVILVPALVLGRTDPGTIRYRLLPRRFRKLDVFYVLISIPLSWGAFELYFGIINPEVPFNWVLPPVPDSEETWRLFLGINGVGMWDELFFVNTVYAILRSIFGFRLANAAQAVIYTSVLTDMAFTGIGPVLVYVFALTQGSMFEESENLLYVLLVHVIVDVFLFAGILNAYYTGYQPIPF